MRGPKIAFCPHCGNQAPQALITSYNAQNPETLEVTEYCLKSCATCSLPLLYQSEPAKVSPRHIFAPGSLGPKDLQLVWPNPGTMHKSVPESVRSCYEEALAIKSRAPNAFANQTRRSLEALCKDRGAIKRTLHDNLKELSTRGEIPPVLVEMTDVLRMQEISALMPQKRQSR